MATVTKDNLSEVSDKDLLEVYTEAVRWWHYNPTSGWEQPTEVSLDALFQEIELRMRVIYWYH